MSTGVGYLEGTYREDLCVCVTTGVLDRRWDPRKGKSRKTSSDQRSVVGVRTYSGDSERRECGDGGTYRCGRKREAESGGSGGGF